MVEKRYDLTRATLSVLFTGSLLVACFWVIQPFLAAIVWALTLLVAVQVSVVGLYLPPVLK